MPPWLVGSHCFLGCWHKGDTIKTLRISLVECEKKYEIFAFTA
jgi:hypothetical protein